MPDSINKLDILLCAAVYDCHTDDVAMLESLDIAAVHFSKAYLRYKKRILAEQKKKQEYNYKKIIRFRIIVAALIAVSILLGSVMSISAVRESIWKTIMNWYEKYIDVRFENDIEKTSPPEIIEVVRKPNEIPEGCEEVNEDDDFIAVYADVYEYLGGIIPYENYLYGPHNTVAIVSNGCMNPDYIDGYHYIQRGVTLEDGYTYVSGDFS